MKDSRRACLVKHVWMRCGISLSKQASVFLPRMLPGKTIYSYRYLSVIADPLKAVRSKWFTLPQGQQWSNTHPKPIPWSLLSCPHASLPEGLTLPGCPARGQLSRREEIIQLGLLNFSSFSSFSFKVLLTTAFPRTVAGCGGDEAAGGSWQTLRCPLGSLDRPSSVLTGQWCCLAIPCVQECVQFLICKDNVWCQVSLS